MLDDATPPPEAKAKAPPRHGGHRDRLRERAAKGGLGALPDYELLELLLFRSVPYKDTKPLAKDLLARFGGLEGIGAASHEAVEGVVARALGYQPGKAEERARIAEADEDIAAGRVISGDEALEWLDRWAAGEDLEEPDLRG